MRNLIIAKKIENRKDMTDVLKKIGSDASGIKIMEPKFYHHVLKITNLPTPAALIIKQEMLSKGGEVATPRGMINGSIAQGDILISGTSQQYKQLIKKLRVQPFGLKKIADRLNQSISPEPLPIMTVRNRTFDFSQKTYIMGVLNVTPDSFSDGGKYYDTRSAVSRTQEMLDQGADIIDIGGQSTRPGAIAISPEEEKQRVLPVIKTLRKKSDLIISIDTYNAAVAQAALDAGADIINDISGLNFDKNMAKVAATHNCPVILMHTQGNPQDMQKNPSYKNLMEEIIESLACSIQKAQDAGINKKNIIIDPGIGFGKTVQHNLTIIKNLNELKSLGCPILIGTSKKSFIGKILGDRTDERIEGTIVSNTLAIWNGASIIRVHDIKELKKTVTMTDSIKYGMEEI